MYYAIRIMVFKFLQELAYNYGWDINGSIVLPDNLYTTGIAICRSVEYHLESTRDGAGSFILLFPLRMAWDAVGRYETAIGTWLIDVLHKIRSGATGRWAVAGYVLDINAPEERYTVTEPSPVLQSKLYQHY